MDGRIDKQTYKIDFKIFWTMLPWCHQEHHNFSETWILRDLSQHKQQPGLRDGSKPVQEVSEGWIFSTSVSRKEGRKKRGKEGLIETQKHSHS